MKGMLYAFLAAFCFGIMPVLTKLIYGETGVDPFYFLAIRYSIAAIVIWGFLGLRGDVLWKTVTWPSFRIVLLLALCCALVTGVYFVALKYIDASLNSLLVFTYPVMVPFLGWALFKEKLERRQVLAAAIGFLGCVLIIGNYQLKGIPGEVMGIGLGLLAGLLYALYTLLGQRVTRQLDPLLITALNMALVAGCYLMLRFSWFWRYPQPFKVYLVAGIIGIVSTLLANYCYFLAMQEIGAVNTGIYSSVEPFFTALLAIVFLGERMRLWQWLGVALFLGAIYLVQHGLASKTPIAPEPTDPGH